MWTLEPAYLLHAVAYRNTSLLADFFTLKHGRVNGVVRGARSTNSQLRGIVQPFVALEISWTGKGDLVTIRQIEPANSSHYLRGGAILYGFYLNELLLRLLRVREAHETLYRAYHHALTCLSRGEASAVTLRLFEKRLLHALGYGLQLGHEYNTGVPIDALAWYEFIPDRGAQRITVNHRAPKWAFPGSSLLALNQENLVCPRDLSDAKRLMRHAIAQVLDFKPLKSRELFRSL